MTDADRGRQQKWQSSAKLLEARAIGNDNSRGRTIADVEVDVARRRHGLDLPRVGARLQQASVVGLAGRNGAGALTSTSHLPALKVISGAIDMVDVWSSGGVGEEK